MSYASIRLQSLIDISEIITIHYFEYSSDFSFEGEVHDFWEFLCVDKGEVEVMADNRSLILNRGDIIFHKPNEFHCLKANRRIAPNLVVIAFCCHSKAMEFFEGKKFVIDDEERRIIADIIKEARETFEEPLDNPYQTQMKKRKQIPIGAEQMIRLRLEGLLLHLMRRHLKDGERQKREAKETIRRKQEDASYHRLLDYMQENISRSLTLEQIARENLMGRSRLQQLVRNIHDCGVMELFSRMKIEEAKQRIRDNQLNFTEIAEQLGYSSIHYFSRQFKKITGMTPSEYSSSIKGMAERE